MSDAKLITLAEYGKLTPRQQGFAQYMQGDWPGSELKHERNPYMAGTTEYSDWVQGQQRGCEVAQDSEE